MTLARFLTDTAEDIDLAAQTLHAELGRDFDHGALGVLDEHAGQKGFQIDEGLAHQKNVEDIAV